MSSLLDCTGSDLRHISSTHLCSVFANSSALSLLSVINFQRATVAASPSWSDALLDFHQYAFLVNSVRFFPNQDPQVGVVCFWTTAYHFSSPQPISASFVVHASRDWAKKPSEETQESCQLGPFDGALYLKLGVECFVYLVHRRHFFVIKLHLRPHASTSLPGTHIGGDGGLGSLQVTFSSFSACPIPTFGPTRGFSSSRFRSKGCAVIPRCHFQPSFDVLARCSPCRQSFWDLVPNFPP